MELEDILTPEERRQRNHDEMIESILLLAREQMRKDGAAALNLNGIARQLGMKTPSLYTYFPSKMAIYDALFRRGMEIFSQQLSDTFDKGEGTARERIRQGFENYMRFATENPELYQIMFERPIPGFEPSEESMAVSLAALEKGREVVEQSISQHELETGLPTDTATDLLIAFTHGITAMHMANEPHMPLGEGRFGSLIPCAVDFILKAWQPDNS